MANMKGYKLVLIQHVHYLECMKISFDPKRALPQVLENLSGHNK